MDEVIGEMVVGRGDDGLVEVVVGDGGRFGEELGGGVGGIGEWVEEGIENGREG